MIKRLFAVSLVTLLVFSFAFAEVDVGSMSNEELINIRNKIDDELIFREFYDIKVLCPGEYVIGKDINFCSFMLMATEITSEHWSTVSVYVEESRDDHSITYAEDVEVGSKIHLSLYEGNVLHVDDGTCYISEG